MAHPLFSKTELQKVKRQLTAASAEYDQKERGGMRWNEYWEQKKAIERAHLIVKASRVQERADEFLNALLIFVGSRGKLFISLDGAFIHSDAAETIEALDTCNTPQGRRELYTILRALTEIPKTWARSAFVRFLRGIGKQKGAEYHGAGMFGTAYGWQEKSITAICEILAGKDSEYAQMLMSYADVEEELRDADPDFEVVDYDASFKATRVERDIEFLNRLCQMLEERGLADVPKGKAQKPKKERRPKVFKSGDIVRKGSIRDLPLPAHIRVNILKRAKGSDEWLADQLDWVVVSLGSSGGFLCYRVGRDGTKAYRASRSYSIESKNWLIGATFIGPWEGELLKKELQYKFYYRQHE